MGFSDKTMSDFIRKNVLQAPAWGDATALSPSDSGSNSPAGLSSPSGDCPKIVGVIYSDGRMSQS